MTDLLAHFVVLATARPGRGERLCDCCKGSGEHEDDRECDPCDGSGIVHREEPPAYCPGREPARPPRRRHWRETEDPDQPRPGRRHWREAAADRPEYGPEPEFHYAPENMPRDQAIEHNERGFEQRRRWKAHVKRGLSLGHITPEQAKGYKYYFGGHETDDRGEPKWQLLPHEMYHVTTDLAGVRQHGLKTRDELAQRHGGHGLGGGEEDTISTTTDRPLAGHILHALHEFHHVVNGHFTPQQMWDQARRGEGAQRPFHQDIAHYYDSKWKEGDELPRGLHQALTGTKRWYTGGTSQDIMDRVEPGAHPARDDEGWMSGHTPPKRMHSYWEKDLPADERLDNAASFYKTFATFREHAGGRPDPMFFATDTKAFAAKDPRNFAVLHVRPRAGAQGYPLHGMGEWRTGTGDALEVHHAERLGEGGHHLVEAVRQHWYHGTNNDFAAGDQVHSAAEIGRETRGGPGDELHVWISNDPYRAGAYGSRIYEVTPHDQPLHTRGPADEYRTSGATVTRELSSQEAARLSRSYQEQSRAYERMRRRAMAEDYFMRHRPMEDGPSVDDVTPMWGDDIYTHPHHHVTMGPDVMEGLAQLRRVRGQPDAKVTIYRASPPDAPHRMHTGDWVSLSRSYAEKHAWSEEHRSPQPWTIHSAEVPARHVRDAGMDAYREQGYWGPDVDSKPVPYRRPAEGMSKQAGNPEEYRMQHQGPDADDGEGMHEIGSGKIWPRDFHERPYDYSLGADPESMDKVSRSRGWPSRKTWVYRAVPSPHRDINPGDWVSTSARYARSEGRVSNDSAEDYPVLKFQARARQLRNEGNSLDEWSYHGPPLKRAQIHFSGGANHRGKSGRGRTDSFCHEHEPDEMFQQEEQDSRDHKARKRAEREAREAEWRREGAAVPPAEHTESVAHMLAHYQPSDADTWQEVSDNINWDHPAVRAFVDDVRRNGVQRPIPVDYEHEPPRVENGHTRLLAAHRAGVETVPTRQHEGFMDPDDPDHLGRQPDDPEHWTNRWEHEGLLRVAAGGEGEDWEENLRRLRYRKRNPPEMHRGMAITLPRDVHDYVTDRMQTPDRQARAIVEHLKSQPLGMHWSAAIDAPRFFSQVEKNRQPGSLKVIVHARLPEVGHIETDPDRLREGAVFGYANWGANEKEIPLREGAPVHITGVTWYGYGNRKVRGNVYGQEHTAGNPYSHLKDRPGPVQRTSVRQREGDEREFEGPDATYVMKYRTEDQGERRPRHIIETYHPEDGKVGELNWYGTTGVIHHIGVEEEHSRRGIATAMWNWGQEMSPRPKHSGDRTEHGKDWAKSVGGPGLRKVKGVAVTSARYEPGMRNPYTGGDEWFHGTRAHQEELSPHGFHDPADMSTGGFEYPDAEEGNHWNAVLGTHFTADHDIAREFAKGEHSSGDNERHEQEWGEDAGRPVHQGIVHARLHLRNPKVYDSEHDMDHEAYEHEFAAGNHPSRHIPLGTGDEDDIGETAEMWPNAHRTYYKYGDHKIPHDAIDDALGYHSVPHPARETWLNTHPDKFDIAMRFRDRLRAQGHDGVIYGNEYERSKHGAEANKSAVVFDPGRVEITQHHGADAPHMGREEAELHRARLPGRGQQELPFGHEGARRHEDIGPVTYSHQEEQPGHHRFDAHDEWGGNVGYAIAEEKPTHVFIDSVYVNPGARGHGIASTLLDNVTDHFRGHELRLKPHPFENERWHESGDAPDEDALRDFYSARGFSDHEPHADDPAPWESIEHMSKQAAARSLQPLRMEPGLYYRSHSTNAPFGPEHASTKNIGEAPSPDMAKYWEPKPGYSAFWDPHHVQQYHQEMGWDDPAEKKHSKIIAFRGTPVGEGADGEPRVMPHSARPEESMSWQHFENRLEVTPGSGSHWSDHTWGEGPEGQQVDDGYRNIGDLGKHAAWVPSARIFGPTYGLDHRLFGEDEQLLPGVRSALLDRLQPIMNRTLGPDWKDVSSVSLAGSEASKWTSPRLEGNNDLDVLVGIAHSYARDRNDDLAGRSDAEVSAALNREFQALFNDDAWEGLAGGPWHLTAYCNEQALDIRRIHPYAAYDLVAGRWVVKPPDLPGWSPDQFPQGPALFQEARALVGQVRAILRLPEPFRSQEASRIWAYIHEGRTRDFSEEGAGWQGTGNVLEKALDQASGHLVDKLKAAVYGPHEAPAALGQGMTTADLAGAHA